MVEWTNRSRLFFFVVGTFPNHAQVMSNCRLTHISCATRKCINDSAEPHNMSFFYSEINRNEQNKNHSEKNVFCSCRLCVLCGCCFCTPEREGGSIVNWNITCKCVTRLRMIDAKCKCQWNAVNIKIHTSKWHLALFCICLFTLFKTSFIWTCTEFVIYQRRKQKQQQFCSWKFMISFWIRTTMEAEENTGKFSFTLIFVFQENLNVRQAENRIYGDFNWIASVDSGSISIHFYQHYDYHISDNLNCI